MLKDSMDPAIRGFADVRLLLSVPPLASIPAIVTAADRRKRRVVAAYSWAGILVTVTGAASLIHFFVLPLDVLWISLLRRFGV